MIIPVILEKDFEEVKRKIIKVEDVAKLIQIDVADGKLVTGETFTDLELINTIYPLCPLEIHLMVENPLSYVDKKMKNVSSILIQVEVSEDIFLFIDKAKKLGYRTGISIKPLTPIEEFEKYVAQVDVVQFLTVEPGAQGNPFLPTVLDKIKSFREKYPEVLIQTDGGINKENLLTVLQAGVNNVVIGSAIFGSENPRTSFLELNKLLPMNEPQISTLSDLNTPSVTKIHKIAFLGGASWEEHEQTYKDAYENAKLLATNGYEIVNGGGPGVMRASTEGAHAAGKRALAITYHPNKVKRHYEGVDLGNHFDEEIITLDYFDRTKVMLQNTDVHIVFNGSIGTLSEFGMTWISSWIHEPDSKPIIMYGAFWNDILDILQNNMLIKKGEREMLKVCTTPQEVLDYIESLQK